MFNKLRNKLIWINFSITTFVIVTVFSIIYFSSQHSANNRPPMPENIQINLENSSTDDVAVKKMISVSIDEEKKAAREQLLFTLIGSGILIEITVIIISYYLAEEAIKPIKKSYENQKIFIANASHEIKTPLAAISANLEAADVKNNKWISNAEAEVAKLANLNAELLTLARSDLNTKTKIHEVDLRKSATQMLDSFKPRFQQKNFDYKINLPDKIKLDEASFLQILSILMDNAVKYSDHKVEVVLNHNTLIVQNDGQTIPAKNLPHIFERFYQSDKTAEGVGLGLSIAKSLAEKNNWELLASSDDKTTTLTLKYR